MSVPAKKIDQTKPESYSPKMPEIASILEMRRRDVNYPETYLLPNKGTKIPSDVKHYGPAYVPFANEFAQLLDYIGQGYGFIYHGDWCKDRSYTIADILSGHAMEPAPLLSEEGVDFLWKVSGFSSRRKYYADPAKGATMSESEMIEAIQHALCTLEQPVIVPQESQWWGSIIVGYKANGKVLVLQHYLPYFVDMENNAQPQIVDFAEWYKENTTLVIAGKREKSLSLIEIYREGLRRIRSCFEINIKGERHHYYDDWEVFLRLSKDDMITQVKRTGIVPGGDHGPIGEDVDIWNVICHSHDSTWCDMAERRFYVMNFCRQAMEYFPEVKEDLQALDDHFMYTNTIMGSQEDGYGSEIGDPVNPDIFEKPEVRARMADCVRRFREADEKGLGMIEALLSRMNL